MIYQMKWYLRSNDNQMKWNDISNQPFKILNEYDN